MRCGLCGCLLEHKAKWKTTTCPDKPERWKPVFMDKATIELRKNFEEQQEKEERKQLIEDKKRAIKAAKLVNEKRGFGNLKAKDLTPNNLKLVYKKIEDAKNAEDNNTKDSK